MTTRIQHRRGTSAEWIDANPILTSGEPAYETDTGKQKIGDGSTRWNDLAYFAGDSAGSTDLQTHIDSLTPHPVYDDGPSLELLYQNAKV